MRSEVATALIAISRDRTISLTMIMAKVFHVRRAICGAGGCGGTVERKECIIARRCAKAARVLASSRLGASSALMVRVAAIGAINSRSYIGDARAELEAVMRLLRVVASRPSPPSLESGSVSDRHPRPLHRPPNPPSRPGRQGPIRRRFPRPVRNRPTPKGCTGGNGRSSGASANAKATRHRELDASERRRFARNLERRRGPSTGWSKSPTRNTGSDPALVRSVPFLMSFGLSTMSPCLKTPRF